MIMRLRGDVTRDVTLTERAQIPVVAETLLLIDGDQELWFRVREIRRAFKMDGDTVDGWDLAVFVTAVPAPASDPKGADRA